MVMGMRRRLYGSLSSSSSRSTISSITTSALTSVVLYSKTRAPPRHHGSNAEHSQSTTQRVERSTAIVRHSRAIDRAPEHPQRVREKEIHNRRTTRVCVEF